jgi:hypothetical protein
MVTMSRLFCASLALAALSLPWPARAGQFDYAGDYLPDPDAVATIDFNGDHERYVPPETDPLCITDKESFATVAGDDAIDGKHYLHIQTRIEDGCAERFLVDVPAERASYRARVWVRHGSVDAQLTVFYPDEVGLETLAAKMGPTGRVTSDGWVELESNELPVDGALAEAVYLRVYDFDSRGSDVDALEVVKAGEYWESQSCKGIADPVCGPEALCIHNACRLGKLYVPPLPSDPLRHDVVDMMQSQMRVFFGGQKTRLVDLPRALATLDAVRHAGDAWTFWSAWAKAFRQLHDWHTQVAGAIHGIERRARLDLCFIEGDADSSAGAWPKHAKYEDLLVSHVGPTIQPIQQGDRLVAVDGQHPIEWALGLVEVDWNQWIANDDEVQTELAERMRALIVAYATSFSVIHCDAGSQSCDAVPETYAVADLPSGGGSQVRCDNRPFYHFEPSLNPPSNHAVGFGFFKGPVIEASPQEAIHALLWDTLYGGGDPNGYVNGNLKSAFADFKQNARGVILDHRAGSGGTLDAAEVATYLVRPPEALAVFMSPMQLGGFDGPADAAEGIALYDAFKALGSAMVVGDADYDPAMPVALLIHRDGSASDFFPLGMKGASSKVKLFGPAPTAGAFSTYYQMRYWAGLSWRLASGDTITAAGQARIGHGVEPDFVVLPKQSDLLASKDTIHEAALAWLRTELKP